MYEKLNQKELEQKLKNVFENDVSYWAKLNILLKLESDNCDELIETIVDNRIKEKELLKKVLSGDTPNMGLIDQIDNIDLDKDFYERLKKLMQDGENNEQFKKVCTETICILEKLPKKYLEKIDEQFYQRLKLSFDEKYKILIDSQNLNGLDLQDETKYMLAIINIKYWKEGND